MATLICVDCDRSFPAPERSQAYAEPLCRGCGRSKWRAAHPAPPPPPPAPSAIGAGRASLSPGNAPCPTCLGAGTVLTLAERVTVTGPAVYLFRDAAGAVLYVGQTADLTRRLRDHQGPSSNRWFHAAVDIEWEIHESRSAALQRELELIRLHRPPHNVRGVSGRRTVGDTIRQAAS